MSDQKPPAPLESGPDKSWEHFEIFKAVKDSIYSLPSRFESNLHVSGVLATDLFAFNSALSASIEEQVVISLNRLRSVWDPEENYALYDFERRPQTFPDVVLKASSTEIQPQIVLGIELKGWYVLAKENEPSFRYKVTPAVCAPWDLLVIVPWALSEVVSGRPRIFSPFVTSAHYAAEYKNWYWQNKMSGSSDKSITLSSEDGFYPSKSLKISDKPRKDSGNNFGRLARTGILDNYRTELFQERLAGISLASWQKFLAIFTETSTPAIVEAELGKLVKAMQKERPDSEKRAKLMEKMKEFAILIDED